ncbi:PREDICTED: LAG1 longevity assurance homolog 1 [Camelina sativa]|uniref:LAG1 longevity assurance homolog 1 n=1 Tax=Camelina sativa TaxID=90675 RepID=A0ABM0ZDC0_CAMSA|nr:PREDICTED: LAG1 longevity assurance homolog 1 [Camelina sativa]
MGVFETVKSIDWEQESYPNYQDLGFLPLFAVFFPSVRFLLDRFVFEKLANLVIYGRKSTNKSDNIKEKKKNSHKVRKFKESAWKCIYYLSAELLALSVTYNEPWFSNTLYFWIGPGDQIWPDQQMKLKLKFLYMFAAGFYTYSIFALVFWETRRSDFGVSMGHHITTVILIVLSYFCRLSRAGSVILALHDASDVFLEIGKMSKYCGAETLASISFVLFALSWVVLRLIYYPFWILWSTSYQIIMTVDKEKHAIDGPILYYMFNTLLYFLLVLHIFWWVLIYRMLVKQVQDRGKLSEDVRSDSESDDEHED